MNMSSDANPPEAEFALEMHHVFQHPPAKIWRCWTEPELLEQWIVPRPWRAKDARIDLRPGGEFSFSVVSEDGEEMRNSGVILDFEEGYRLITTDAFRPGWIPNSTPVMVGHLTLEPQDNGNATLYKARAMHWNIDAKRHHVQMGFHEGWAVSAMQLSGLLTTL